MSDEETIVIRVNAAQGEAALRALGKAGIEAGQGIEKIGPAASGVDLNLKDLTRNIGAGISLIAILRDNLEALKPALDQVGDGIKFAAVQAGASEKTVSNLGLAFDSLIHPSHIAANAVESLRRAWGELEEAVVGSSEVIPNGVRTIEQSLTALAAARKAAASVQEEALTGEQAALAATAKEEAALEAAALKSSQERAKAEAQAAEEIVAALARESQALADKTAADEARLAASLAKGAPLDTSVDTSEAQGELSDLRSEIQKLENQPLISPDQLNNLNDMKDRAARLTRTVSDLNNVFTVGSDNWLNDADAANAAAAAQDLYGDMLARAQMRQEDALRTTEDADDALTDFSDTAEGAADALGEVADAAGAIGDEAKKGADKAGESMAEMIEGLKEAIPLSKELRDVLAEVKMLGATADI